MSGRRVVKKVMKCVAKRRGCGQRRTQGKANGGRGAGQSEERAAQKADCARHGKAENGREIRQSAAARQRVSKGKVDGARGDGVRKVAQCEAKRGRCVAQYKWLTWRSKGWRDNARQKGTECVGKADCEGKRGQGRERRSAGQKGWRSADGTKSVRGEGGWSKEKSGVGCGKCVAKQRETMQSVAQCVAKCGRRRIKTEGFAPPVYRLRFSANSYLSSPGGAPTATLRSLNSPLKWYCSCGLL